MIASLVILGLVTAQRLGELVIARRNTGRLLAAGGVTLLVLPTGSRSSRVAVSASPAGVLAYGTFQ